MTSEPQTGAPPLSKSLDQLEGRLKPVRIAATPIERRCEKLRALPLGDLAPGDLAVLIGQRIGLDAVVPRAIELLEAAPLTSGGDYPGDLLGTVLRLDRDFWRNRLRLHARVAAIADVLASVPEEIAAELDEFPRTMSA